MFGGRGICKIIFLQRTAKYQYLSGTALRGGLQSSRSSTQTARKHSSPVAAEWHQPLPQVSSPPRPEPRQHPLDKGVRVAPAQRRFLLLSPFFLLHLSARAWLWPSAGTRQCCRGVLCWGAHQPAGRGTGTFSEGHLRLPLGAFGFLILLLQSSLAGLRELAAGYLW